MNIEEQISRKRSDIKTLEQQSEQAVEILNANIRSREWHLAKTASENLIYFEDKLEQLRRDIAELAQVQEKEALEVVT